MRTPVSRSSRGSYNNGGNLISICSNVLQYIKGGLSPQCQYGAVFVKGQVRVEGEVGRLLGNNTGTISNSYSTGAVSGQESVGGLVGINSYQEILTGDDYWGIIKNSYSTGNVTGDENFGGLVGKAEEDTETIASYWDIGFSGKDNSPAGEGRTSEQMQAGTPNAVLDDDGNEDPQGNIIYADWEEAIWDFGSPTEYPSLQWE